MKRGQWNTTKYCRKQRQYQEMSARFTHITGSVGFAGLHHYITHTEQAVRAIEQAADDPDSDLDALIGQLETVAGGTQFLEVHLGHIRNSCVRYINAYEEIAPTSPPPRPRVRFDPGSASRWSRRRHELPPGVMAYGDSGDHPAVEDHP